MKNLKDTEKKTFSVSGNSVSVLNKIKEEIPNTNFGDGLNWDLRHNGGTLSRKMLEGHRKYQKQKKLKDSRTRYQLNKLKKEGKKKVKEVIQQYGIEVVQDTLSEEMS